MFCLFCLNWLSRHVFGSRIRSNRDTTSHIKPSPSGCTASSPWWGLSKGFLIRRCPSTRPGSTRCSAQTAHHTSPSSLWVRPSCFCLDTLSGCKGILWFWCLLSSSFFFFFVVRDAAARLPNGEGTRAEICELLKDSQFLAPDVTSAQVITFTYMFRPYIGRWKSQFSVADAASSLVFSV